MPEVMTDNNDDEIMEIETREQIIQILCVHLNDNTLQLQN